MRISVAEWLATWRGLQPSLGASDARGFGAIGRAEFADSFRQVVAHRAFGKVQLGGDVIAGHTFSRQSQNLSLALGQRVRLVGPGFGCELRVDDAQSGVNATHGVS